MILNDGQEQLGTDYDDTFVGPTVTVETQMGTYRLPNGPISDVTLHMGLGNDSIVGNATNSAFYGNEGADLLAISGGAVTLSGGAGNDMITMGSNGGSVAAGGSGNDEIEYRGFVHSTAADTIFGGDGDDTIVARVNPTSGTSIAPVLIAGDGADQIYVTSDEVDVNPGDDVEAIVLKDFDPDEDTLTVLLTGEAGREFESATLEKLPAEGSSELRLGFIDQATGGSYQTVIRFDGRTDISPSDINLRIGS